jgi:Cft2 family RNA processing exonuclease
VEWDVRSRNGIWLPQIDWWLDAPKPAPRSIISHAHADHVASHQVALCTAATADLISTRQNGRLSPTVRTIPFHTPTTLSPDTTLTFVPAGHVLGSAQALIEHREFGKLLYTGDFKLRPGGTAEPCATPHADVLIMETTFGLPHYCFPPSAEVFSNIVAFCRETHDAGEIPILLGYSLGRSQEILKGLTGADLPIMLHPMVEKVARCYERWGQTFPAYTTFAPLFARGHVILAPSQALNTEVFASIQPRRTATITGWAIDRETRYRSGCDAAFPLSDHAGFDDLLSFVEAVNPRRVFTVHGFAEQFAATLRQRGREAWALGRNNQLEFSI